MDFYKHLATDAFKQSILELNDPNTTALFTKLICVLEELGIDMSSPDEDTEVMASAYKEDGSLDWGKISSNLVNTLDQAEKARNKIALSPENTLAYRNLLDLKNKYALTFVVTYIDLLARKGLHASVEFADATCSFADSLDRGELLLRFSTVLTPSDFMQLFFEQWPRIEIADFIYKKLKPVLSRFKCAQAMERFASNESLDAYYALPEKLTVYRGCSSSTKDGLSWTTDLDTAKTFAYRRLGMFGKGMFKIRLMTSTQSPVIQQRIADLEYEDTFIVKGYVNKSDLLSFVDGSEKEIVSCKVYVTDEILIQDEDAVKNAKFN